MTNGYYVNLETPLQQIPKAVTSWITTEQTETGLLSEIDKVWDTFRTMGTVESYEIWIRKLDWSFKDDETYVLGDATATIEYPFEIAIIIDLDDEEEAENKAIQLQAKTIMSIFKNYTPRIFENINDGYINYFKLEYGYNDGTITALNQEGDVIIKGFRLVLNITIDWLECMKKHENTINNDSSISNG